MTTNQPEFMDVSHIGRKIIEMLIGISKIHYIYRTNEGYILSEDNSSGTASESGSKDEIILKFAKHQTKDHLVYYLGKLVNDINCFVEYFSERHEDRRSNTTIDTKEIEDLFNGMIGYINSNTELENKTEEKDLKWAIRSDRNNCSGHIYSDKATTNGDFYKDWLSPSTKYPCLNVLYASIFGNSNTVAEFVIRMKSAYEKQLEIHVIQPIPSK